MPVTVHFSCGGCDAEAEGTTFLQRSFRGTNGSWGWGSVVDINTVESVAPEGWIAFDPYTQCCYCPECWKSIEDGIEEAREEKLDV